MVKRNAQNIQHDQYDHKKYMHTFHETDLSQTLKAGYGEYAQFRELTQDLFYSMYKYAPEFEAADQIHPDFHLNRYLEEQAFQTQAWSQLRAYTKGNDGSAAMAAATLGESILKENEDLFNEIKTLQEKAQQQKKSLAEIKKELADLKKQPQDPQVKQHQQALEQKAKTQLTEFNKTQGQMQTCGQQMNVFSAVSAAADTTKSVEDLFHSYGGSDAGTGYTRVSVEDRINFSKVFVSNKRFQKLIKLLGKMSRLAEKKQKEKTHHARETIDNIIQSDDLSHILASESLLLCEPELEVLFDKKFVEKGLLVYELNAQTPMGKGPIVCALDISGSMTGDKDLIAKAVALALVHIAHMQHRDAFVMLFDGVLQYCEEFERRDPEWWAKLIQMVGVFTGGGTTYDPPVTKAIEIFTENLTYLKADFIMVTDMDYGFSDKVKNAFLDLKAEKKISTYCIIVDPQVAALNPRDHCTSPIMDTMVAVEELTDDIAGNLFEAI